MKDFEKKELINFLIKILILWTFEFFLFGLIFYNQPKIFLSSVEFLQNEIKLNPQLEILLKKAIFLGTKINPDLNTNPIQNLNDYYNFLNFTEKSLPHVLFFTQPKKYKIYEKIDQCLNYFFFISNIQLNELNQFNLYNNTLQYYKPFENFLKFFALNWGKFLNSKESWNENFYKIYLNDEKFNLNKNWYENHKNWKSFNDFFSRKLLNKHSRPIFNENNDKFLIIPADSTPQGIWTIKNGIIQIEEKKLIIKSKEFINISTLFSNKSKFINNFKNGILTHSFLDVFDYHRFHFPISGTVKEIIKIEGNFAVGGSINWNEKEKKYLLDSHIPSWESIETRALIILENKMFGLIAILPVGMMPVSSIEFERNLKVGKKVKKGEMFGTFLFGGSDFIIVFNDNCEFKLTAEKNENGQFKHLLMGEKLGELYVKNNN